MGHSWHPLLIMIQATINSSDFQQALASLTALVNEAKIQFEGTGLRVTTVDPANVGAVEMVLLAEAFEEYEASETNVCVSLDRIESIVKKTGKGSAIRFGLDSENRKFQLHIGHYDFAISLLNQDSVREGYDAREVDPPARLVLESDRLREAINVSSMFSDHIIMGVDPGREVFYMNSKGDNDSMHMTLGSEDVEDAEFKRAHSIFSLDYLREMIAAGPPNTDINLQLGQEYPAKIYYEIAGGDGRITYGLAPRIE